MGVLDLPLKTWTTPGNRFGGNGCVSFAMPNAFNSDLIKVKIKTCKISKRHLMK